MCSSDLQQTGKVPVTTEEIKKFQEANGLKPDGVAGPMTIELMRKKGVYPSESGVKGLIIQELNKAGITSPAAIANIFATVKAESGFRSRSEEISEERANKNYGNNPGLGNKLPGDGYKFRGRGLIQHTGRAQYEVLSRASGLDLINNPDQLNDPAIAAKTIPWFFLKYKSFIINKNNFGLNLIYKIIINILLNSNIPDKDELLKMEYIDVPYVKFFCGLIKNDNVVIDAYQKYKIILNEENIKNFNKNI